MSRGGGAGITDHAFLSGKEKLNQHPISSITSLQSELDNKATVSAVNTLKLEVITLPFELINTPINNVELCRDRFRTKMSETTPPYTYDFTPLDKLMECINGREKFVLDVKQLSGDRSFYAIATNVRYDYRNRSNVILFTISTSTSYAGIYEYELELQFGTDDYDALKLTKNNTISYREALTKLNSISPSNGVIKADVINAVGTVPTTMDLGYKPFVCPSAGRCVVIANATTPPRIKFQVETNSGVVRLFSNAVVGYVGGSFDVNKGDLVYQLQDAETAIINYQRFYPII